VLTRACTTPRPVMRSPTSTACGASSPSSLMEALRSLNDSSAHGAQQVRHYSFRRTPKPREASRSRKVSLFLASCASSTLAVTPASS